MTSEPWLNQAKTSIRTKKQYTKILMAELSFSQLRFEFVILIIRRKIEQENRHLRD